MAAERVSIKQIAEKAGCSVATVSRVINQNGRFSKETEERVQAAIREYGYVPDLAARNLRTNSSHIVAVILPSIEIEVFAKTYRQIHERLQKMGYMTVIIDTYEDTTQESGGSSPFEILSMLRAMNICGIVVISLRSMYDSLKDIQVPAVYIDCPIQTDSLNCAVINYDLYQAGRQVAEKLVSNGCRQVACVTNLHSGVDSPMYAGLADGLREHGLTLDCGGEYYSRSTSFHEIERLLSRVLEKGIPFDALVLPKDMEAVAAAYVLTQRGFRIPEDVCLVGCDDVSIAEEAFMRITTVHLDTDGAARLAISCLMDMMQGKGLAERSFDVPLWLVERDTTR